MSTHIPNVHPGEVLLEEFLEPMGLSQNQLALAISVPANRINAIVRGQRAISADTALRLAHFFGTSAEFWLGLQNDYDLEEAKHAAGKLLERIVPAETCLSPLPEPSFYSDHFYVPTISPRYDREADPRSEAWARFAGEPLLGPIRFPMGFLRKENEDAGGTDEALRSEYAIAA